MTCSTPQPEDRILFLQDDTLSFDYGPNSRMGQRFFPLVDNADVLRFVEVDEAIQAIKCKHPPTSGLITVDGRDAVDLRRLEDEKVELIRRVALKFQDPDGPCVCTSGRKFKKCCRRGMMGASA